MKRKIKKVSIPFKSGLSCNIVKICGIDSFGQQGSQSPSNRVLVVTEWMDEKNGYLNFMSQSPSNRVLVVTATFCFQIPIKSRF